MTYCYVNDVSAYKFETRSSDFAVSTAVSMPTNIFLHTQHWYWTCKEKVTST